MLYSQVWCVEPPAAGDAALVSLSGPSGGGGRVVGGLESGHGQDHPWVLWLGGEAALETANRTDMGHGRLLLLHGRTMWLHSLDPSCFGWRSRCSSEMMMMTSAARRGFDPG
jgi:hypothetical protein